MPSDAPRRRAAPGTSSWYERRWRLPPPEIWGTEPLEGARILEEVRGPLGLVLWQTMRDVGLWAVTSTDARPRLFSPDAESRRLADLLASDGVADEIEAPLRALTSLLGQPADIAPEAVMLACQRISQWAEAGGCTATAAGFAQVAALAMPAAPRPALRVAQLARLDGEPGRAEGWYQRAAILARQERDRTAQALAYTGLGRVYFGRGNMPLARRCHLRALRVAERFSLRERAAAALHELFVVAAESGDTAQATEYAARAFEYYGPRHAKLPALAHDVALLWLRAGDYGRALPVLTAVAPRVPEDKRALLHATTARAAAGAGDRLAFLQHSGAAVQALDAAPANAARVHLSLARGALLLHDFDRGERLASRALEEARGLREHKTEFAAEDLIREAQELRAASTAVAPAVHSPVRADDPFVDQLVHSLAVTT